MDGKKSKYSQGFVRKRGTNWQAVISWQEDGTQKSIAKSTGIKCEENSNRGKASAEAFLRAWRDELVRTEEEAQTTSRTSFIEYVRDFIAMKESMKTVEATTIVGYTSSMKQLLGSPIANKPISEITSRDIEEWERMLVEQGLSPATISHTHVFMKQVMSKAKKRGDVVENPFDDVDAPKRVAKPINALDKDGIKKLNAALDIYTDDAAFVLAVRLALMTGMRQGEICALRWKDIDLERNEIHVAYALKRVRGTYVLGSPKTQKSSRIIPVGPMLAAELAEHLEKSKLACAQLDTPWLDDNYVVGSPIDGSFFNAHILSRKWHIFSRMIGLTGTQNEGVRFHDLRHTFATHAIASGQDVKTVSVILGHANAAMTLNIYSDALEDSKRQSMDALDSILSAA